MSETLQEASMGRIVRETPGRVRWRRIKRTDSKYHPLASSLKDEEFVLEQEWTVETLDQEQAVFGPPETEWRDVPTEESEQL
jgi:hypothetical protein